MSINDDFAESIKRVSRHALDIFELGISFEREKLFEYLRECASKIDFLKAMPNEAIPILLEAYEQGEKKSESENE